MTGPIASNRVAPAALRGAGDLNPGPLAMLAACYLAVAGVAHLRVRVRTLLLLDPAAVLRVA